MGTNDAPASRVAQLAKADPLGLHLLRLLAMLAPAQLDRACFHSPAVDPLVRPRCERSGATAGRDGDRQGIDRAIDRLVAASLLVAHSHDDGTAMLRGDTAVFDAVRAAMPIGEIRDCVQAALILVDAHAPEDSDDPRRWPQYRRLLPHIECILALAEEHAITEPTGRLMGEKLGVFVFLTGDRERGEKLFRRALAIDEAQFGPRHAQVAVDCNNLSIAIARPASLDESEALIARAVDILLDQEQQQPARLATSLGVLGGKLSRRGLSAKVEQMYRFALALDEQHCGKEHIAVARDLRLLGSLLLSQDRAAEAEPLIGRALAIDERDDAHSPNLPADLWLLAVVSAKTDPTADVIALLERAAAIDAQWYGGDHERVIAGLLELADACVARGRMGHGQQHLEDALRRVCATAMPAPDQVAAVIDRIAAHVVGSVDIDPDVLVQTLALVLARWPDRVALASRTRATAATALQRRRRWIEARQLLLEAEEARLRQQIERTPANARAWGALALFLKNQRPDYDEAERCYRRAAELAPHDPSQVFNLGLFLTRVRGRHDDGEALMRHALESAPNDAILLSGFAFFLHHERGLPAEAEVLYQKALGIAPTEASILGNVASVRLAEGRLPEARELIERSVKTEADSDVTLRALFLGAVAARLAGADPAPWIAQLRQLLGRGIAGNPWHPRGLMAELPRRLQAGDARFFATLQAFLFPLSGRTVEAQELEEFEAWRGAVGAEIDAV